MKKKLLFIIESLGLGGAEKSLVTLLNLLDYSRYEVDLLLFAQGGAFQQLLPEQVRLLPVPEYFAYTAIPWAQLGKKLKSPRMLAAQLRYSAALRTGKHDNIEKAVLFWESAGSCLGSMDKEYDTAIAYAQGTPTFFAAEKVKAKKKAAWINATYFPKGRYLDFIKPMYRHFDYVNAVSDSVAEQMRQTLAIPDSEAVIIRDILDAGLPERMSRMESDVRAAMAGSGVKILTVGRLAKMKGYDLAIDAARLLADRGLDFTWYVLGEGGLRPELEARIARNGLQEKFILLGSRSNPYPFFKACDLYVQTSRFEGFGISLAEGRMFRKPIVTTNFDAVGAQITNEQNGLIVDISARAIADGIIRMLTDTQLREVCTANLAKEKIGNPEEIEKLYDLLEG